MEVAPDPVSALRNTNIREEEKKKKGTVCYKGHERSLFESTPALFYRPVLLVLLMG